MQLEHGHFCPSPIRFSSTKFSLHFGEKTFCWAPPSFSSLPLSTKHPSKSFPSSFSFSLFFPIFSKIHSTKHNLNLSILKKKKLREREIIAPLLTGLERFDHQSSTKGCRRLVDAKFWVITIWTLWLCNRKFLVFSSSIWRDLVKRFYFLRKIFEDQVILILLFLFGSLYQLILLLPFGVFLTMAIIRCCCCNYQGSFLLF